MKTFIFSLTLLFSLHAVQVVEDQSTLEIRTPSLQKVQTRKLRLDNELEVLLISDPDTPQSAAALSVEVGQWQDPNDAPGMAHFIEHLLFLGNETYPEENDLKNLLDKNGGLMNAYTSLEHTNYHYVVNNDALPEILKHFAPMFISPIFTDDAMRREECAVDQEFRRCMENDGWRAMLVNDELSNPDHPNSKFAVGNAETLHRIGNKEAHEWFKSHYSANLMHVAVISSLPLDELQEIVIAEFSAIPNRNLKPFRVPGTILSDEKRVIAIKPYQTQRKLQLQWEFPKEPDSKPVELIGYVLAHQGEGSLYSELKERGLIEGIDSDYAAFDTTSLFELSFSLTKRGAENYKEILGICYQAIANIQKNGIPKTLYDEQESITHLTYAYQTRGNLFFTIRSHGEKLINEDLATYPDRRYLPTRYDSKEIAKTANFLSPDACRIALVTPDPNIRFNRHEKWIGTSYALLPYKRPKKIASNPCLHLPTLNPYIPGNFALTEAKEVTPTLLSQTSYGTFYFAPDTRYEVPEIAHIFTIKSATLQEPTPKQTVLNELMIRTLNETLNQEAYLAETAGLSLNITPHPFGLVIALSGFRDKSSLLTEKLVKALQTTPSEEEFAIYKESLSLNYNNASKKPALRQGLKLYTDLTFKGSVTDEQKAEAIQQLQLKDLQAYTKTFWNQTYIEGMLFGNMEKNAAEEIIQLIRTSQHMPFPEGETLRPQVLALEKKRGPYRISRQLKTDNGAALLAIDHGPLTNSSFASHAILGANLSAPFFKELRTEQQTGYAVGSFSDEQEGELYSIFVVESNTHDPADLLSRYEQFIQNFTASLSEEIFEEIRASEIEQLKQPPKNPAEMATHLHTLAFKYQNFDLIDEQLVALETITFDDYTTFARDTLSSQNRRRLALLLNGNKTDALRYRPVTLNKFKRKVATYTTTAKCLEYGLRSKSCF